MAKDRDSDAAGPTSGQNAQNQSKRPLLNHHASHDSDSQASDHASTPAHHSSHHRPKKHAVGVGRLHTRVPSSKAVHKLHHNTTSSTKLHKEKETEKEKDKDKDAHRRQASPSPERPERPPMLSSTHRRSTSDALKQLSRDSSSTNLKRNSSHTSLKRNRSHVEVAKRPKSSANIKRSSSTKDVNKLHHKSAKSQVHFDLGNDGDGQVDEGEWIDASASASPYLSRRASVVSSGQSSAKATESGEASPGPTTPAAAPGPAAHAPDVNNSPDRERIQHKQYLTSRLLQRTPSYGAPPQMSSETAQIPPHSASPDSALSRESSTVYGTPKTSSSTTHASNTFVGSAKEGLTSRFVSGPISGVNPDSGSFYSPSRQLSLRQNERVKRPRSLGNLHKEHRDSITDDAGDEDDSALAPRTSRRPSHRAPPADQTRTQQKLNLQRASSSIEPTQAGSGVGAVGSCPLVGGPVYDNRDPRIGKLLERTGQEYLVVRRYQNPIARSIARLQELRGAEKTKHIPKQNGANGATHSKKNSDLGGGRGYGLSGSLMESQKSRPTTPRRTHSIRTNGGNSSYDAEEERPHDRTHDRISGSSYVDGDNDGVAALLRHMWDKSMDLSASQD